ncbi:nucleotide exchange factor GrpE [Marinicauda salina]|jgi:molecular chaperone GrpE|uniref:Protein GrpE n=1 Tax=Marinicauda salina TaxID=2135793 RepID=A0A2U2BWN1_9PROT|nr:nucleotide exchange factor GrpE [Marinicauda salina]PWE18390.1 nucleotide exchange factor GrpE [Marinicauda salina]
MTQDNARPEDETETENAEAADAADGGEAETDSRPDAEKSVEQLTAELDDLRDRLLRAVADAENTRKRAQREVRDTREYAVTGFARDMLDIADNLRRAIESVDQETRDNASEALKNLVEGVEMTERKLLSTLEGHGVKKVDPEPGEPLDPNRHQAAAQIPADQPKGRIAHVMQPGYVIGDRTLRAAMVVVSAGGGEGDESGETPDAPEGGVDVEA